MANSEKVPAVVTRPILLPFSSVNHRAPSGPAVIPWGVLLAVGMMNSLTTPAVVIRPILLPAGPLMVNHTALSGPAPMAWELLVVAGRANFAQSAARVICSTWVRGD